MNNTSPLDSRPKGMDSRCPQSKSKRQCGSKGELPQSGGGDGRLSRTKIEEAPLNISKTHAPLKRRTSCGLFNATHSKQTKVTPVSPVIVHTEAVLID